MQTCRYAVVSSMDGVLGAPEPIADDAAAHIRTHIFRDGAFGSMHRRSDGGWTVFGPSGRIELVPLVGELHA